MSICTCSYGKPLLELVQGAEEKCQACSCRLGAEDEAGFLTDFTYQDSRLCIPPVCLSDLMITCKLFAGLVVKGTSVLWDTKIT